MAFSFDVDVVAQHLLISAGVIARIGGCADSNQDQLDLAAACRCGRVWRATFLGRVLADSQALYTAELLIAAELTRAVRANLCQCPRVQAREADAQQLRHQRACETIVAQQKQLDAAHNTLQAVQRDRDTVLQRLVTAEDEAKQLLRERAALVEDLTRAYKRAQPQLRSERVVLVDIQE
jgi:hypothetical protein